MLKTAAILQLKNLSSPEQTRKAIFDELRQDFADWMTENEDVVWRPVLELTKQNNEYVARAFVPGVDPADIEVLVAPDILLIKGKVLRSSRKTKLLCSIKFPELINAEKVHVEMKSGIVSVRSRIAGTAEAKTPAALAA
jgi:HSP20 family molecular chaperone IbpA